MKECGRPAVQPGRVANQRRRDDLGSMPTVLSSITRSSHACFGLCPGGTCSPFGAVALFASAGTFAIAGFWVYLAIFAAVFVASFPCSIPDCCASACGRAEKPAAGAVALYRGPLLHWIVAGLDRGRFHWSDTCRLGSRPRASSRSPPATRWRCGRCSSIGSSRRWCASSPTAANTWSRRGLTRIRHPGYLAGIVIIVASGIALGSWLAAALLIVLSLPFLLYRAITEDRVLQADLPGYRDYAARVRWRLMPGIW